VQAENWEGNYATVSPEDLRKGDVDAESRGNDVLKLPRRTVSRAGSMIETTGSRRKAELLPLSEEDRMRPDERIRMIVGANPAPAPASRVHISGDGNAVSSRSSRDVPEHLSKRLPVTINQPPLQSEVKDRRGKGDGHYPDADYQRSQRSPRKPHGESRAEHLDDDRSALLPSVADAIEPRIEKQTVEGIISINPKVPRAVNPYLGPLR
jgi:hypothetical protein